MLATCVELATSILRTLILCIIDTTCIEAACAESITGAHLRAVYQLITAAPLTPTNSIANSKARWWLVFVLCVLVVSDRHIPESTGQGGP